MTGIADFTRISIPLMRRIRPSLIADNIVGVQPLSQPSGLAFYLKFRYQGVILEVPTHQAIQQRAFILSKEDPVERHPEYYWHRAQNELVSPIIRAIAEEAGEGIIFKPGNKPDTPYEFWRPQNDRAFARANIENDNLVIREVKNSFNHTIFRFNLHLEDDITNIINCLHTLLEESYERA